MLILKEKIDDIYSILDTDDMVVETLNKEELLNILKKGIFIYGVSEFSLEYNVDITLILRLYGKDDIKDFDGLLLRDYFNDYNEFDTQIIDWRDNSDTLVLDSVFYEVIDIIRHHNKVNKEINTDLPVGYKVFASGDDSVTLKELSSGNVYTCDFYTCLYIYVQEELSIEGIDEISYDYMICNGNYYSDRKILNDYKESSISSNIRKMLKISNAELDDFYSTWDSLDAAFGNNDCIKVTDCDFPLYNIKNCIKRNNYNTIDIDFETLLSVAVELKVGKLYFENGHYIAEARDIAKFINIINFVSNELKEEVFSYIESAKTKELVLKKNIGVNDNLKISANHVNDDICIITCPSYRINDIRHKDICIARTKFGLIYNRQSDIINLDSSFASVFLVRLTHCGSCWFDTEKGKVIVGTSKSSWRGGNLCNDEFIDSCWQGIRNGISYHEDTIIPLGMSSIKVDNNALDIRIVCMILGDIECTLKHSINVVEVPLLFLGSRLDEFNDCFRLVGLYTTLYLEKSVVYNLEGYFEEDSFMNIWESLSTKPCKELYNTLYKHSKNLFKQVSDL